MARMTRFEAVVTRNTRAMLIFKVHGRNLWGMFPGSKQPAWGLRCDLIQGDRITFMATVDSPANTVNVDPYSITVVGCSQKPLTEKQIRTLEKTWGAGFVPSNRQ